MNYRGRRLCEHCELRMDCYCAARHDIIPRNGLTDCDFYVKAKPAKLAKPTETTPTSEPPIKEIKWTTRKYVKNST